MGGFHGGFLIWDGLEKVCGRKMDGNTKIQRFLGKNPLVVPVPKSGTGTHDAVGKWYRYHSNWYRYPLAVRDWYWYQSKWYRYTASTALFLHIFAPLSFVFVYRLFRDPKKLLMGVK